MARPPFPRNLTAFQREVATEEACEAYLEQCRWPDGFRCPECEATRAYRLERQRRWQCAKCRHQASLTSGTVLDNTKTPLTVWFWAAFVMATDKRGVSALLLQDQLGVSYKTAWLLLHKLRRSTVAEGRTPLSGSSRWTRRGSGAASRASGAAASSGAGRPRSSSSPWSAGAGGRAGRAWRSSPTSARRP